MIDIFPIVKPVLYSLPPETAHSAALFALRHGFIPYKKQPENNMLSQNIWGLHFKNPIGLAAGFDKNAVAINNLLKQGFAFVEAGTVTPLAQAGNEKPRIFRLEEDKAIINRLGFNNMGLEYFVKNFSSRDKGLGIAGANIGKNKDTEDAASDYVKGLNSVYRYADYITINISSPNTKGLRDLQNKNALFELLSAINEARNKAEVIHHKRLPIMLKIAPDLDYKQCEEIAENVTAQNIDGLIISNTTISRPTSLKSKNRSEIGGLSGSPLFTLSTMIVKEMYKLTGKKIPIIGVGGISSTHDAYAKILAGASLLQLYSALIYQGFGLIRKINSELPELLARDGFSHIGEAIGATAYTQFNN